MSEPALRPLRSVLYMPGSNARALEKAKAIAADGLILDLEDAVAPDAKAQAREQVCDAARSGEYGRRVLTIRVNGPSSCFGQKPAPRERAGFFHGRSNLENRPVSPS